MFCLNKKNSIAYSKNSIVCSKNIIANSKINNVNKTDSNNK